MNLMKIIQKLREKILTVDNQALLYKGRTLEKKF